MAGSWSCVPCRPTPVARASTTTAAAHPSWGQGAYDLGLLHRLQACRLSCLISCQYRPHVHVACLHTLVPGPFAAPMSSRISMRDQASEVSSKGPNPVVCCRRSLRETTPRAARALASPLQAPGMHRLCPCTDLGLFCLCSRLP